jgi:hypothetical protein
MATCCKARWILHVAFDVTGTFGARETVQKVFEFVQSFLADPATEFTLLLPSSSHKFDNSKVLVDVGLVPSTLIHCLPTGSTQPSLALDHAMVTKHAKV